MGAILGRIISAIFGSRTFLSGLMVVVISIIFYNLAVEIIGEIFTFSLNKINGVSVGSAPTASFSGYVGWWVCNLKIPQAISVVTSAVGTKFILRKIPFIRW